MTLTLRRSLSGYAIYDMARLSEFGLPGVLIHRLPPGTTREAAEAELARRKEETA